MKNMQKLLAGKLSDDEKSLVWFKVYSTSLNYILCCEPDWELLFNELKFIYQGASLFLRNMYHFVWGMGADVRRLCILGLLWFYCHICYVGVQRWRWYKETPGQNK